MEAPLRTEQVYRRKRFCLLQDDRSYKNCYNTDEVHQWCDETSCYIVTGYIAVMIPPIRAITGSLAPHGINVAVMIVRRRSLSASIVLEAMIPGIPQPEEIKAG